LEGTKALIEVIEEIEEIEEIVAISPLRAVPV
jgi:hypothetical protein